MERVPEIYWRYSMMVVSLGIWISADLEKERKRNRTHNPHGAR